MKSFEMVNGKYEPRIGASIARAIQEALEDLPKGQVGIFAMDHANIEFRSTDTAVEIWNRLIAAHGEKK